MHSRVNPMISSQALICTVKKLIIQLSLALVPLAPAIVGKILGTSIVDSCLHATRTRYATVLFPRTC
jgi:hypothetical protein